MIPELVMFSAVHATPMADESPAPAQVIPAPTMLWFASQLVPSPELAFGKNNAGDFKTSFGLRWQLSPIVWSFGVHPSQSRWRFFVVDPIARHSGSIELSTNFEWIGGHVDNLFVRPGIRTYLPLAHKGEYLSMSLGTSIVPLNGVQVAYEAGLYFLSGNLGFLVTVAPKHEALATIATLRLRYF